MSVALEGAELVDERGLGSAANKRRPTVPADAEGADLLEAIRAGHPVFLTGSVQVPFWQRAAEAVVAGVILLFTAPIILLEAIVIRHGTPGPALFRQQRIGLGGVPFPS